MHQYINEMKEHEFVLWVIGANAKDKGKFVYELPKNVVEVHEVFLDDALRLKDSGKMLHAFTEEETNSLKELMLCRRPNWEILFRLYHDQKLNPMSFLRSEEFLNILTECCIKDYPYTPFADAFHTMRSMLLPVLYLMGSEVPKADVYHAICTGYGGLLACLGGHVYKKKVLLTEHGIYTREREEEIIRAKWVQPAFKKQWISFFYMLSDIIYTRAFLVSALFTNAMHAQIQMGCDKEKCRVVENGINYERLSPIPLKEEDGWVDIGAIVRLAPIKDIKTMIYAFYELCTTREHVRLHIMGGVDDEEYAQECYALVDQLHLDMFLCRPARLFFNQVTEIVGRKMQFPGTVSHRRQSDLLGPVRNEVFVEHVFETHQNIAVHFVARNELPFVEPHAVIEQQLDIHRDNRLAVTVDPML